MTIPAGQTLSIDLVMENVVGGRYAQQADFFISVNDVLVSKSIVLEGQARPDPHAAEDNTADEATGPTEATVESAEGETSP